MSSFRKIAMVLTGTVIEFFAGIMYTWSNFRIQLAEAFPTVTASQFSLTFTLAMMLFCFGSFFGGKISAAKDQRFTLRIAGCLLTLGMLVASFAGNFESGTALLLLYLGFGALLGLGSGMTGNCLLGCVNPWFPDKVGLVSGVLLMGTGLGSLLLGILAEALFPHIGPYAVMRIFAVVTFLVVMAGSFVMVPPQKTVTTASEEAAVENEGCTTREMLARPSFWLFFIWNIVLSSSGMLVFNSSASISVYYGGAATLGLVTSLANGCGRPVTGTAIDKLGQFRGMMLMNIILVISGLLLVLTSFTGSIPAMCVGLVGVGICYGGGVTIGSKVIYDTYGPKHYGVNFSMMIFCMIPAAFIGPYLSARMQDASGGGYEGSFYMLVGLAVVALLIAIALKLRIDVEKKHEAQ